MLHSLVEALDSRTLLAAAPVPAQLVLGPSYDLTLEASTAAPDGSLIVAGNFGLGMDMDPRGTTLNIPTTGQRTWFVAKYTRQGAPIWVKTIDVANQDQTHLNIQAIATDASGNIFLAGNLNGPFDFDPGPKARVLTPVAGAIHELTSDTFLWKLSAKGEYVFAKLTNHITTATEDIYALAVDRFGNPYVSGSATPMSAQNSSPTGPAQPFVTKYSATGQVAWSKNLLANALAVGADDGPWLGAAGSNLTLTHLTGRGKFVSSFFGAAPTPLFAPTPTITPASIDFDAANNLIVAGSFTYRANFAPNDDDPIVLGAKQSNAFRDIFLARYTPSGETSFAFSIGTSAENDRAFAARVHKPSGNIYLAGDFSDNTDFDPSRSSQHLINPGGDAFVARYTARGRFASVATIHTSQSDYVRGLALTPGPLPFLAFENSNVDTEQQRIYLHQPNLLA